MNTYIVFLHVLFLLNVNIDVISTLSINSTLDEKICSTEGIDLINHDNIDSFLGCTIINGSITINNASFTKMLPNKLDAFRTVKVISGYLNIENTDSNLKNLSFFSNLETIQGQHSKFHTLYIFNTSIEALDLISLKEVGGIGVIIMDNKHLCFVYTIEWEKLMDKKAHQNVKDNRLEEDCEAQSLTCDSECRDGCWGLGPEKCVNCTGYLDTNIKNISKCRKCHDECTICNGPGPDNCDSCKNKKVFSIFESSANFTCTSKDEEYRDCSSDPVDKSIYYCCMEKTYNYNTIIILAIIWPIVILFIVIFKKQLYNIYNIDKSLIRPNDNSTRKVSENIYESIPSEHLDIHENTNNSTRTPFIQADIQEIENTFKNPSEIKRQTGNKYFKDITEYRKGTFGPLYRTSELGRENTVLIIQLLNTDIIEDLPNFESRMQKINEIKFKYLLEVTVELEFNDIRLITELVPLGNILNHIKCNKQLIRPGDLLRWCHQISIGMQFLEQNQIVHGNLSARNILLNLDLDIKIKDFGRLYLIGDSYKKDKFFNCCRNLSKSEVCPLDHNFNHKYDVWTFGLTMYELLTFGENPWEFITYNRDNVLRSELEWGIKIPCPEICKDDMYAFMRDCWHKNENMRPDFNKLSRGLMSIVSNPKKYVIISDFVNL